MASLSNDIVTHMVRLQPVQAAVRVSPAAYPWLHHTTGGPNAPLVTELTISLFRFSFCVDHEKRAGGAPRHVTLANW